MDPHAPAINSVQKTGRYSFSRELCTSQGVMTLYFVFFEKTSAFISNQEILVIFWQEKIGARQENRSLP